MLTLADVQIIERIVRSSCCTQEVARFESWLGVDQDQALAVIEMIRGRLSPYPLYDPFAGAELHSCANAKCDVRLGPGSGLYCFQHEAKPVTGQRK